MRQGDRNAMLKMMWISWRTLWNTSTLWYQNIDNFSTQSHFKAMSLLVVYHTLILYEFHYFKSGQRGLKVKKSFITMTWQRTQEIGVFKALYLYFHPVPPWVIRWKLTDTDPPGANLLTAKSQLNTMGKKKTIKKTCGHSLGLLAN